MNNIINIGGKDYPFHFGMRVFWYVSQSGEIEFDQVEGRIESDYDSFLEMFVLANKSALDRKGSEALPVTKRQLEIAIDDDPDLLFTLQEAFRNSSVVKKLQEKAGDLEGNEKKPTG